MRIGFFGINFGVAGDVDAMISIAKAAEAAGLESVWTVSTSCFRTRVWLLRLPILKRRFSILRSRSVTSPRIPSGSVLERV